MNSTVIYSIINQSTSKLDSKLNKDYWYVTISISAPADVTSKDVNQHSVYTKWIKSTKLNETAT